MGGGGGGIVMVLPVEKKRVGGSPNPGRVPCVIHNFGGL